MPNTTDDLIEYYVDAGYNALEADKLAHNYVVDNNYQINLDEYAEDFNFNEKKRINTNDPQVRKRVIKAMITKREKKLARDRRDIRRRYQIGCDFKGVEYIQEYDDEKIYIPKSDYCFIRCIEKCNNIIISKENLNPFGDSLTSLRSSIKLVIDEDKIPDIIKINFKMVNEGEENEFISKQYVTTDKTKLKNMGHKILLINIDDCDYHAVLVKSNTIDDEIYEFIKDNITTVMNLELSEDQIKIKIPKYKSPERYAIVYDIETSTFKSHIAKTIIDPIVEVRTQNPEGVAYALLDFELNKVIFKDKKIGVGCYNNFIQDICNRIESDNIILFAHNGGCFDNIYAKGVTSLKHIEQIKKGRIKKLVTEHKESGKKLTFLDTYVFFQASLKDSCRFFGINDNKKEFDIVNKDHEFFCKTNEWIPYMEQDVKVLGDIVLKYESYMRHFGESMTTSMCGVASIAWSMCTNTCYGMKKIYRSKDPSTIQLIRDSIYGGRMLHYDKTFDSAKDKSEGLICLDGNALYPSAMFMGMYPVGKFKVIPNIKLDIFIKKYLNNFMCIAEVTLDAGNQRYPLLPYRTDKGCVIYPNGIFTGVYNSVDLLEAVNDGYKIIEFKRGIFWLKKKKIYSNLMEFLHNKRNELKDEKNPMEYVYKILSNSMYGGNSLVIGDMTVFSEEEKPIVSGRITRTSKLKNGQYEHLVKLKHPLIHRPIQLSSFITSYSRKIMNNYIREIGPENIKYSDTDSLYVPIECLKSIKETKILGGLKNDYGKGLLIKKAIFLDTKRYLVIFNKADDNGNTFKAKFNGINFKNNGCLKNWCDNSDTTKIEALTKLYEWFYNNPNKILDKNIFQERWKRNVSEVTINLEEMQYQVNPEIRNNWNGDKSYPVKLDKEKYIKYKDDIEFINLGPKTEFEEGESYTHDINNYGIFSSLPICGKVQEDITMNSIKNYHGEKKITNNEFRTTFIRSKDDQQIYIKNDNKFHHFNGYKKMEEIDEEEIGEYEELLIIPNNTNKLMPRLSIDEVTGMMEYIEKILIK